MMSPISQFLYEGGELWKIRASVIIENDKYEYFWMILTDILCVIKGKVVFYLSRVVT